MNQILINSIEQASKVIGKTWPLYSFVASNPLSGYEKTSFKEAISSAEQYLNANVFPSAKSFRQAWEKGAISKEVVVKLLKENGMVDAPENYLKQIESQKNIETVNPNHELDRIMAKWLSVFMDEGLAEWEMPYKTEGFYSAWRNLVIYDAETGKTSLKEIPKTSLENLELILKDQAETDYAKIFTSHLAALPGWTGYINHRETSGSDWQKEFPINSMDYLAVRLWTAKKLNISITAEVTKSRLETEISKLQYIWLKAWEESWQNQLVENLENNKITVATNSIPDAQMVFCIDTRSELIRRHVENKGNYETFGYAGFFGIAMDYTDLKNGITRKSCPPIVSSAYTVTEKPSLTKETNFTAFEKKNEQSQFKSYFLTRMKNMLPSAFGFVEISGLFYGFSLLAKTLIPKKLHNINADEKMQVETICEPNINKESSIEDIPLAEKVAIVKSGFNLMGWKKFAPLVVFVGHGSHTTNNPFGSSLDCGACAASPGRHNARMLAKLANLQEVRAVLSKDHGIVIPEKTVFIGAEHNTTTDQIELFDAQVPVSYKNLLDTLKINLSKAQQTATEDRLNIASKSVSFAEQKANDWGETRPEWGLAKNAGFIIGSRNLTKNKNLDSRCFLHSYDWEQDTTGKALEGIMQGPMVVTQWINNHYYFSTVDNNVYGGGSKITHNVTGKFGVVQGNGGDLKMGLPMQSLFESDEEMYHEPLRLSVLINAPVTRVNDILERNNNLKELLDNEWIYLMVMDPNENNKVAQYKKGMQWKPKSSIANPSVKVKKEKAAIIEN
uniref:DUF2309 domain-containing protein n=1 Tax=Flavobacterium sp. TaxID=239 RepID=UPI00404B5690